MIPQQTQQNGCYKPNWEKCADLPSPLYNPSVALHDNKVYVMAGKTPDHAILDYVYIYHITTNCWDRLPPPGHHMSKLLIVNKKLTVIGGRNNATAKITNKVTTFNNKKGRWTDDYPNMLKARINPGAVVYLDFIIVASGELDDNIFSDDIEVLNYKQSSCWMVSSIKLPKPMKAPCLITSGDLLYIVGYTSINGNSRKVYQIPAAQITKTQTVYWTELTPAPYHEAAVIPDSCPPVIVGGRHRNFVPTADIRVLDIPNNSWKKIGSLTTARNCTAAIYINHNFILVIGGCTGGVDGSAHSITTVEKGKIT